MVSFDEISLRGSCCPRLVTWLFEHNLGIFPLISTGNKSSKLLTSWAESILVMKAPDDPIINNFKTQFDGVDVRIYDPLTRDDGLLGPVLIFIHGGGWVLGDIDSYDLTSESV